MAPVQNKVYIITFKKSALEADKKDIKDQVIAEGKLIAAVQNEYYANASQAEKWSTSTPS
ncbi:hypothetical protein FRC07_001272 [Ceratobasidium sp. 392]|nr:hypothetical protein FRC07_001272 [Ceratobasidium sp. 392]